MNNQLQLFDSLNQPQVEVPTIGNNDDPMPFINESTVVDLVLIAE